MSEIQDEDMKLYPCSNCGDYYPYCGIENHLESCLLENIVEDCKFCGETVVKKLIEQHQQNCQAFALQEKEDDVCEFCQEKIFKQFKQDHYSDCALKQIADTYQFYTAHECPICLIDIGPMDQKGVLECCHIFHQNCLQAWQKKSQECPVCRYN
ncbi:unnamed protein product (macronuclear) [Paramecium tetraurelia]|uniref:RING-type domain-containing protein n=1 Tax=Paramecium tetraurelia TaxID=5888 RepID=A0D4U9_PARTE|nr:uncharacterized protein GSPATT00013513001 [Paramecium tetraurelia]CAK78066.1 unnamed protein product [Paramecium tetraurelia]|eukprot:XP_001445463.1 hypothetical protein (macronuclear) [Paramecium tetraurelia strain d4-2]